MAFPLGLAALGAAALVGLGLAAASKSKTAPGTRPQTLVKDHVYQLNVRNTTNRPGTFADRDSLTKRLEALGFSAVFILPNDDEPDPSIWRARGIWDAALPALVDGNGVAFLGAEDISSVPAQHKFDAGLPADLEATVDRMLAADNDVSELVDFAAQLLPDFPIASNQLNFKASQLQALQPQPLSPTPPSLPIVPPQPVAPAAPITPVAPATPLLPPVPEPAPDAGAPPAPAVFDPTQLSDTDFFDPGAPASPLPPIPAAGAVDTPAHRAHQQALVRFFARHSIGDRFGDLLKSPNVDGTIGYDASQIDGQIGPKTQHATWAFQRWANDLHQAGLAEDGLPGPSTASALAALAG